MGPNVAICCQVLDLNRSVKYYDNAKKRTMVALMPARYFGRLVAIKLVRVQLLDGGN